ncbi:hypothetical protein HIM_05419 [Hirsutella minnesotensis 3608]|uniref:Uncharacterized protein n=1 Tax=Hirsutella minnesotensis 3608 TaxID=1043627 RepID=A0A0F7ZPB8_9HYPO|nr:hypothetical protein HIM_05419 [Hirsutella minnesotensis 3608]
MALETVDSRSPSAAFFCPQSKAPDAEYLAGLHASLKSTQPGRRLLEHVAALEADGIWNVFAEARADVRALSQGPQYVDMLRDWAVHGTGGPLAAARSGIVALPLLVILQIGQYLRYLQAHGMSHEVFLESVRNAGGLQGYCGGLPSAIAISCGTNETEVVDNAAAAMRILLGIGAYGEAADESNGAGSTTLALRLKYEGQGDDLTSHFPGTHVSAITDPKSVSIVGPAGELNRLFHFAKDQGLQVQKMDIRGKVHNPENKQLAVELNALCNATPCLQLPEASSLQVSVRSNKDGAKLLQGSLTEEIVSTILASRCDWFSLLGQVAKDLAKAQRSSHNFIIFGLNDCVPMVPFHRMGLRATKTEAHALIRKVTEPLGTEDYVDSSIFPENAIAIVGASCRLPGANDLEELWDLLAGGGDCHEELPTDRFDLHNSFRASQSGSFVKGRKFYGNFIKNIRRFDHAFFGVNAREAINMDPQQRILLELSHEALDSAGYLANHRRESGDDVGCFIGASLVEYLDNTSAHPPTAYTSTGTIRAFLCGRLSHFYGWSGPAEVIDTACSSSLVAINRACKAIQTGECRMALAGGVNAITGMNNYFDLGKAGFLSPTGQCKPFDAAADGYCRSDGAGLVVLKKLKQAIGDGDQILGVIPGVATNQGGMSSSITVPDSDAQKALYRKVLAQAGLRPDQVTYVEAHGTGTQAGDPLEMDSLRSVFGSSARTRSLHVGSIKGNIGHCETSAGVAGLLKTLAMIRHGHIPPQKSHRTLNPKIALLEPDRLAIARSLMPWDTPFRAALVNSYGAAGSNCALLCCEMPRCRESDEQQAKSVIELPLTLTASSPSSLIQNARTLAAHLGSNGKDIRVSDLVYTLNARRQKFKHRTTLPVSTIKEAMAALNSLEATDITQMACPAKPVVFAFAGQSDNKVALEESFYNTFPAFRRYINACDSVLQDRGHPSILPAIFQTEPIADIAVLQCSIFAMQYASAKCWIDAGLHPAAIVGHSLGELTGLVVSGVLSLSDGLHLIASRGRLIQTKWGPEKGEMLAMTCSPQELRLLSSLLETKHLLTSDSPHFEIACYNGPNSLVAVGSSEVITAAQGLIQTEVALAKIRCQRLATSHGFHSALIEPILADLDSVSETLTWNEPSIPLEVCSTSRIQTYKKYSVSRHARQPVYFEDAIKRVEETYGAVTWLEAGINTPIINMVRKATRRPEAHSFQAAKTNSTNLAIDVVSDVVFGLSRSGLVANHWALLQGDSYRLEHIWLPPYQFDRSKHWLDNIDRVVEMQKILMKHPSEVAPKITAPPTRLLSPRLTKATRSGVAEYVVNVQSQRFRDIVGGHAVRSRPLCPASMYMECATMALQQLLKDPSLKGSSLIFEELRFHNALGVEPQGEVVLQIESVNEEKSWAFSIYTSVTGPKTKEVLHGNGRIGLTATPMFDTIERLVSRPMLRITKSNDVERLMSKRAYSLFSRVVDYAEFFRGIHSIALDVSEAVATINLPEKQPAREESTAWNSCDTVLLDSFIQVVGLLLNTSDLVSPSQVMVMVGLDRAAISPACATADQSRWKVYAKFDDEQGPQLVGDVFVFSPENKLVASLCGCRFASLAISKLEKALDAARTSRQQPVQESPRLTSGSSSSISTSSEAGYIETPATSTPGQSAVSPMHAIKELIAEYTGLDAADIMQDTPLADIGLDSLASVELVEELSSRFGLVLASTEVVFMTLRDILKRLDGIDESAFLLDLSVPSFAQAMPASRPAEQNASSAASCVSSSCQKFMALLSDVSGANVGDIRLSDGLADIGVDSLSLVDLKQELEEDFSVSLEDLLLSNTVEEVVNRLGISAASSNTAGPIQHPIAIPNFESPSQAKPAIATLSNPFEALQEAGSHFSTSASKRGFLDYWRNVAPHQDELLLAYILEGFTALGADLRLFTPGQVIPQFSYQQNKYDRLVPRLWEILQSHGVVSIDEAGNIRRGNSVIDDRSSSILQSRFEELFPEYEHEFQLIGLTGPRLADCLSGKADAVSIMFGNAASLKTMENFYGESPMMSTMTEQLVLFLITLLKRSSSNHSVRILEVGAGTGGTTKRLAEALAIAGIETCYTFTDISASLVSKAKHKFKQYPWIDYATFNLEKDIPERFRNRFDIVVSANCVHATTDRTASCRRLREVLTRDGLMVLSEVTRVIDWYDICFGLLDGWWLVDGRTSYPLQPAKAWMSTFEAAGFAMSSYSQGPTAEANSQQLLVASKKPWDVPLQRSTSLNESPDSGAPCLETLVYKETDGIQIHADVFFPKRSTSPRMPIALMIHGGGHMTLSRKAIRPFQTLHLLSNGFLPVSIDYRLCPEVSLIDGPFADVRDAYQWARVKLPDIARQRGFDLDASKIVVVGWSSGGHLAMSLGWTAEEIGLPPPTAILSFYAPVDFESGELDSNRRTTVPGRTMDLERIMAALPSTPITNYTNVANSDSSELGWLRPGDARSELVLALLKDGIGLPLLLNGLPRTPQAAVATNTTHSSSMPEWLSPPSPERVASISPLARLRAGQYSVPTYLIHSTADEIAPFAAAERFTSELKARGVRHGLLPLENMSHLHDLKLRPGSRAWDSQAGPGFRFLFDAVGFS